MGSYYSVDSILDSDVSVLGSLLGSVGSVLGLVLGSVLGSILASVLGSGLGSEGSVLGSARWEIESLDIYFHYNGNIFLYYNYFVSNKNNFSLKNIIFSNV